MAVYVMAPNEEDLPVQADIEIVNILSLKDKNKK